MNLLPVIRTRYFDHSTGAPLVGGKLYTYQAGTTTLQATYTDSSGGTPNANPVVLDANGEASVWADPTLSYKFVLQDSNGVQQWSVDNVIGLLTNNSVGTASIQDGAVTTVKIAALAIDSTKLASDASIDLNRAVTTNSIRDSAITRAKLSLPGSLPLPTVQKFTTGSGTYTTPASARYIRVRMVGGGGGGGGAGSSGGSAGGAGAASTFGTTLLSAGGGGGGLTGNSGASGGAGGTSALGTGPVGLALTGNGASSTASPNSQGQSGAGSALGGGGQGVGGGPGGNGADNTGGGGAGGGISSSSAFPGAGGGSGGYIDAIITSLNATYSYAVGTGGSAGTAGTNGSAGGSGGSGVIIVEEYYQ